MIPFLNKLISRLKGSAFQLDPALPFSYLFGLILRRGLMLVRGFFSFVPNDGMLFIGRSVTLRARRSMRFGRGVSLDDGSLIDALSYDGVVFGHGVSLGKRSVIECSGSLQHLGRGLTVGNQVGLGRDCFYGCAGGIIIGENTIMGNFVSFHAENHRSADLAVPIRLQGVTHQGIVIGQDCWIGAKATILDGVRLGDGSIVAAGAVLTAGEYPARGIYGGVPARLLKFREGC